MGSKSGKVCRNSSSGPFLPCNGFKNKSWSQFTHHSQVISWRGKEGLRLAFLLFCSDKHSLTEWGYSQMVPSKSYCSRLHFQLLNPQISQAAFVELDSSCLVENLLCQKNKKVNIKPCKMKQLLWMLLCDTTFSQQTTQTLQRKHYPTVRLVQVPGSWPTKMIITTSVPDSQLLRTDVVGLNKNDRWQCN